MGLNWPGFIGALNNMNELSKTNKEYFELYEDFKAMLIENKKLIDLTSDLLSVLTDKNDKLIEKYGRKNAP